MNRFTSLFLLSIALATAIGCFQFCKKDPINCKDDDVGDVYLSEQAKAFWPTQPAQVAFSNQNGVTKTYATSTTASRIPLHIEKLCEGLNLSTGYNTMDGDLVLTRFQSGSDSIVVQVSMVSASLRGKSDTAFYDHIQLLHFDEDAGSELTKIMCMRGHDSNIPTSDINAQTARFIGDTTLLGKTFQKVYTGRLVSGSPNGSKNALYIADGIGLVAFTQKNGTIWVRQ